MALCQNRKASAISVITELARVGTIGLSADLRKLNSRFALHFKRAQLFLYLIFVNLRFASKKLVKVNPCG